MLAAVLVGVVSKPVSDLQAILRAIGVPDVVVSMDGLYGPKTADAWAIVASSLGLDGRFERVDGKTARVSKAALDRLRYEAVIRQAPKPVGTDTFTRLNNAIARANWAGPGFDKLAKDWQDEVYEERSWKIAIPPLWAETLNRYVTRYRNLYLEAPVSTQLGLVPPEYLDPSAGSVVQAFKDLWQPALAAAGDTYASAVERVEATLRAAGKEVAEGARRESLDWAIGAAAGVGVIALFWIATRGRPSSMAEVSSFRRGFAGFGRVRLTPKLAQLRDASLRAHSSWWHAKMNKAPRSQIRAARRRFREAALAFRQAWDEAASERTAA